MTYATHLDLTDRFGDAEIALIDPDGAKVAAAIADASAEIDGVLAIAYDLPLPEGTWPLLTGIACALARHRLYDDAEPEAVKEAALRARAKLRSIADGKYRLVATNGALAARRTAAKAISPDPVFTRKALEGF